MVKLNVHFNYDAYQAVAKKLFIVRSVWFFGFKDYDRYTNILTINTKGRSSIIEKSEALDRWSDFFYKEYVREKFKMFV